MKSLLDLLWRKAGSFVPAELHRDPELERRARLVSRFGLLGSAFGLVYACFYFVLHHYWGVTIVLACSAGVAAAPVILALTRSLPLAGHLLAFILTAGFTGLCCVEGGLRGHAIAWLVSVPLCAMLLVGKQAAKWWALFSMLSAGAIAGADLAGIELPVTYNPAWHSLISAAGYMGLILFMVILGAVFESGRERALLKMSHALSQLAEKNEQLVLLNQEKNEFMGIAAHDLKNPLTAIIGRAELLSLNQDPARVKHAAEMIVAAGTRMRDLILNLLDANAIDHGAYAPKMEPCDLGVLTRECLEHNHASAARKQIQIRTTLPEGLWVCADRALTIQIIDNLVSNAIKYSPLASWIQVEVFPSEGNAVLSVRDNGPGIGEADQKNLFKRFTRLSAVPTGGESSTGLGLSIVKRLAEVLNGSVDCQSQLGSGSTFFLHLPIASAFAAAPQKQSLRSPNVVALCDVRRAA
ncbi:MAG: signal transduction histidine kinase [Verrucomicrobiales bacterium]|nr:signal transduction histidine kinase [Verrucomicrobiales bacterium]